MMQKYKIELNNTFCNFCKSVGHEDKNCRTLELMKEITSYAYSMHVELMVGHAAPHFGNAQQFQAVLNF
jgi:hypothetical protein